MVQRKVRSGLIGRDREYEVLLLLAEFALTTLIQHRGAGRMSVGSRTRPWRGVAAHPLALAGLRRALAVGQYRLAAADDEPRPSGDCPAVVDGVPGP